ncbi:MAG: tetraacyldisaccharide 4'-kinase [Thermodesulfovibrionales bacterium]|nr:tetraacyldisaccharide 4'-kinase [Thermodesulfovibrionales bacterium]
MTPLELLYFFGSSLKKYQALQRRKRLPCRVISIGNLTLGGTGKTPAVISLAREAKNRGWKPCILTRGYRGKVPGPCFVSNGETLLLNEEQAGDEALLIAGKLQGVPVVKGKDRYRSGLFALSSLPANRRPDLFILDDGFQHWMLSRDKDVLLVDGTNPFGNRRLFPLGPLREPVKEAGRADIIVITKTESGDRQLLLLNNQKSGDTPHPSLPPRGGGMGGGDRKEETSLNGLMEDLQRVNPRAPVFRAGHRATGFLSTRGESYPLEWGSGKEFFGFCGIGSPRSFEKSLIASGLRLKRVKAFRDHYRFSQGDIEEIRREAEEKSAQWIVTTEKDIMRLKNFALPENLVSLLIEFTVDDRFYDAVLNF